MTWQSVDPGPMTWQAADAFCSDLAAGGFDDWRLPTISELRTLVRGCPTTETNGSCGVVDSCLQTSCDTGGCSFCEDGQGPNNGCFGAPELSSECGCFWSASSVDGHQDLWWDLDFNDGDVDSNDGDVNLVRCVRP